MGDHLVLNVDRLVAPQAVETVQPALPPPSKEGSSSDGREEDEEEPLIHMAECRICQEEDHIKNLEVPCACSGSLKYAHRVCVQRWCNEKGDITCEICHEGYKPGYTAPPRVQPDETTIDISGGWTITGTPLDLRDPRILAMAAAQRHFLEAEYDEYAATNASGSAFCRSAALILMALLLLRHALTISNGDGDDDASTYFSVSEIYIHFITSYTFENLIIYLYSLFFHFCHILPMAKTAIFAASCWISVAMLHHGLGYKYFAAPKAKTGSSCIGSN
ncbi:uncharacterized protein M6B38_195795 [Iris pallida]|uniref:RING-CH-type domain-containing protein n=1 Tax=Iris pallida TaxID=29817 RepID=A0AAX6EC89_IRIPA|nr:uncharacterized protein M6B38_195795 [Iris pallida]